jgi:hypothetical protein
MDVKGVTVNYVVLERRRSFFFVCVLILAFLKTVSCVDSCVRVHTANFEIDRFSSKYPDTPHYAQL